MLSSSYWLVYKNFFIVSAACSFDFHLSRLAECLRKLGCRRSKVRVEAMPWAVPGAAEQVGRDQ